MHISVIKKIWLDTVVSFPRTDYKSQLVQLIINSN